MNGRWGQRPSVDWSIGLDAPARTDDLRKLCEVCDRPVFILNHPRTRPHRVLCQRCAASELKYA